ncbi:MAG: RNA-binding protein [Burkholderiales bacterium]
MSERLWIGNVPPDATDEEVAELAKKYSGLDGKVVQRIDGDGTRPARVLEFAGAPLGAVDTLALRLAGLYWKERALHAHRVQHAPGQT